MPKIIDTQGRNEKTPKPKDICPTLRAEAHGNLPMVVDDTYANRPPRYYDEAAPTLRADRAGLKVRACLTPDRLEKRQNGRRFKEVGEESFTLTAQDKHGVLLDDGRIVRIRRLTPKECFRLQGWTDDYFERARFVNSDSQLYKQAGNGVTVTVIEAIGRRLKECERGI